MFIQDRLETVRRWAAEPVARRADRSVCRVGSPEPLECRVLLSAAVGSIATPAIDATPVVIAANAPYLITPAATSPYTPANIQGAYGVSQISFHGTAGTGVGQTIAIIDAYNDPSIVSDVGVFDTRFGLPQFNSTGNPTFTVVNQNDHASPLPANSTSSNGGWDTEESLDVEWAHAIAPHANIILFEANSASSTDLYAAVTAAAATTGVSVVSMSFGSPEFNGEQGYDSVFTTPAGHQGVTFLASTGDNDAPAGYPAYSPNVVAVGGTSLTINGTTTYGGETAWGNVSSGVGGGGGISAYESQPSYQAGNVNNLSSTARTAPDVSMLADVNTGVYMYDSYNGGGYNGSYFVAGGTSLACPMWAGLIAIADQGRALSGLGTLDGPSQVLPRLYNLPSSDFHDITSGNNGFAAGSGYDLATGIGSPIANLLVPALAGISQSASNLAFNVSPSNTNVGSTISPSITVDVTDASGDIITTDSSNVTLSFGANPGDATLSGTATVHAVNGVATFTGLSINNVGQGYTLVATDGLLTSATSAAFNITMPASAAQLVIVHQPGNTTVGIAMSSSVMVDVVDSSGNLVTSDTSSVTLTVNTGGAFAGGGNTVSVNAVGGVATFSNLVFTNAGFFGLTASDGQLIATATNAFYVFKATPAVTVTDLGGTYSGLAFGATSAIARDPNLNQTLANLGSGLLSYSYFAGTLTTINQAIGATPLAGAPINAGAYTVVATYAGSANYNTSMSIPVNFSIARRTLHVIATGQNKIYDGTTTATPLFSDDRVVGDSLTVGDSSAVFASKDVGTGILISISGMFISGSAAANYILANSTATTIANITPLAIDGTITVENKVYDGTTTATIASETLAGVRGNDQVSLTGGTANFNSPGVLTATAVTVTGLSLTGAQAGDYTLNNPTETVAAKINPLPITGSITAAGKIYDATTAAALTSETLSSVLSPDAVTLTGGIATFATSAVGNNKIVTASGLSLSGAQAGDYVLTDPAETTTASITPLGISGIVFNDPGSGGAISPGITTGLAGRTVILQIAGHGASGQRSTRTDVTGAFSFTNLTPGNYILKTTLLAHWRSTTPASNGDAITLHPGATVGGIAFGQTDSASVSGSVFLDANRDGKRQNTETGLAGWTVTLTASGSSTPMFTMTTNASGDYAFSNLPIGTYSVSIVETAGYGATTKSKTSYPLSLIAGKIVTNENFGQEFLTTLAALVHKRRVA